MFELSYQFKTTYEYFCYIQIEETQQLCNLYQYFFNDMVIHLTTELEIPMTNKYDIVSVALLYFHLSLMSFLLRFRFPDIFDNFFLDES